MENLLAEKAIQLVIMDAIEKGNTNPSELAVYMGTDVFKNAAANYYKLLYETF